MKYGKDNVWSVVANYGQRWQEQVRSSQTTDNNYGQRTTINGIIYFDIRRGG